MSNNFEILIQMLKKSLILIALFFIIAAIPARAESLQELINRHKEHALIKAKIKMQELIADTLELKGYRKTNPEFGDINNYEFYYEAQFGLNTNAFYFDDTTSIYSIIDTTQIVLDRIHVFDKQHYDLLDLCDNGDALWVCSSGGSPNTAFYERLQNQKKIFGEEIQLIAINKLQVYFAVLNKNKIFVQKWMDDTYIDINDFIKKDTNAEIRKIHYNSIRHEGINKRVYDIAKNGFKPQIKRDFSNQIKRIEGVLDSLDSIYLKPILNNKNSNFYLKIISKGQSFSSIHNLLSNLGITYDEFIRDSAKLTIRSEYRFKFQNTDRVDISLTDSISFVDSTLATLIPNKNYSFMQKYNLFWENKFIGYFTVENRYPYNSFEDICTYDWLLNGINEYADSYQWCIAIDGGYLCKINDELKIIFGYNEYFKNAPISFDLFIEQIIDEYNTRKDYRK